MQFEIILLTLFLAVSINVLLKKIHIQPLIGYIFTGIIIKSLFEGVSHKEFDVLAEFGVVFLMFMIGLEFSFPHMKAMKKEVFLLGGLEVLTITLILTWSLSYLFPLSTSLIIALAFSLSSTAIVMKILQDKQGLYRNHGRIALGILLFQDIAVVPILILISFLGSAQSDLSSLTITTLFNMVSVVGVMILFGRYGVDFLLRHVSQSRSNELFMVSVLLIVLTSAYIAHFFSISYSLGAFLAGMMLAESHFKHKIEADLTPFRDLFLGLFFITVGLQLEGEFVLTHSLTILGATLTIMTLKTLLIFGIVTLFYTQRTAIKSALLLSQVGEFSFVIFALSQNYQLLTYEQTQLLIAIVVLSMMTTPFLARLVTPISYRFADTKKEQELLLHSQSLKHHAIIIGYGSIGSRIVERCIVEHIDYIAIDTHRDVALNAQSQGLNVIYANATKGTILEHVGIRDALYVIIAIDDEKSTITLSTTIKADYPHIRIIVAARNAKTKKILQNTGVDFVIDQGDEVAKTLLHALHTASS